MEEAIIYGLSLIGAPYSPWIDGKELDSGDPAWNDDSNEDLPSRETIFKEGMFCTGLANLMLRKIGKSIPRYDKFNGGIYSYQITYKLYAFDINNISYGDALFRPYTSFEDQGHIAIVLDNGKVLQCFFSDGVNATYTVEESNYNNYYKYIIKDLWA